MATEPDVEAGGKSARTLPVIRSLRGSFLGHFSSTPSEAGEASSRPPLEPGASPAKTLSRRASVSKGQGQTWQIQGGLLSGNALSPGEAGDIVSAVKNLRKASMVLNHGSDTNRSPGLATKTGSVCSYFYAPNATPGKGAVFSPAGDLVLRYGYGPDVKVLRSRDASVAASFSHPTGHIRFATFSQDSKLLAAASDDCRLLVWNIEECIDNNKRRPMATIDVGEEPLAYCLVSPTGDTVLSCDDDGQLELWSIPNECMVHRFEINHAAKVCSFNEDGSMVISCSDFEVQVTLLDAQSGSFVGTETFDQLEECRNKAAYVISPDGAHVLVYITEQCHFNNCAVFNTRTQSYHKLLACNGAVVHAEFSRDGAEFVVAGRDDQIHVYDSATGSAIVTLIGHTSDVMYCKVSADRTLAISGDNGGHVLLWDVLSGNCQVRLQGHSQPVVMCDINKDNSRALTLDNEGHAYLWNLDVQSLYDAMRQNSDMLCAARYMPSGNAVVMGYSDGAVKLWRLQGDLSQRWVQNHHDSPVECIAVRSDGYLIAAGFRDGTVVLLSSQAGERLSKLEGHSDCVTCLHFSSNGAMLGSCSRDGTLRVWSTEHHVHAAPLHTIRVPNNSEILAFAIASHNKCAALGCASGAAYVYSLASSRQLHAMQVADVAVQSVEFCAAGKYLAIGCADGVTTVYDAESGQCLRHLVGNAQGVIANYFPNSAGKSSLSELSVVTLCSRQAITWELHNSNKASIADFVADDHGLFHNRTMANRYFVGHNCLSMFDPTLNAAMYDMRLYDKPPGDSYLFRHGTCLLMAGQEQHPIILYAPPHTTVHMLLSESGGTRAIDFSSDGHLLVSGNLRGELVVWDVEHRMQLHKWAAHKRSAITCVKFSHDSTSIYSCGEDCKVILWNWRTQTQISMLSGHQAPVASVDMALDGSIMASGDKDGIVIIWDPELLQPKQIVAAHEGAVLCCSLSPDGSKVASSGADEHIVILDSVTGAELVVLDSALDGKGLTIKFSFDGTRVQIGGEKGSVLIWDVERNCLLYDIEAHNGKVFDCSWSGDSRRLLSVGSDGRARLWDSSAGSELVAANLERGFGAVEAGGFVKCDLSVDGSNMAGCTARGQLVLWSIASEMRKGPEGSMLYQWLASMPLSRARDIYQQLLSCFPLLMNTQDSRGWTVLMHAAHDSNPEILKLIVGNVRARSGMLGLTASMACRGLSASEVKAALVAGSGLSVHQNKATFSGMLKQRNSNTILDPGESIGTDQPIEPLHIPPAAASKAPSGRLNNKQFAQSNVRFGGVSVKELEPSPDYPDHPDHHKVDRSSTSESSRPSNTPQRHRSWVQRIFSTSRVAPEHSLDDSFIETGEDHYQEAESEEPNAIRIALAANSADCVGHLIDAVLTEKITPGSYHAMTDAIPEVAERYPTLCETFMNGLPLMVLGDVEVPSSMASQDSIVRVANSYTSYKEMWAEELELDKTEHGTPMVVMEAVMVRLPFAVSKGDNSLLRTIVEADVAVEIYGSETLKAIIAYKWQEFARRQIYTKSLVYLTYVATFTAFAVVFSDDIPTNTFRDLLDYPKGQTTIALCIVLFMFGSYYMCMEMYQLYTIGVKAYFDSFWNFIDLLSYGATLVVMPCVLARYNLGQGQFVPALIAVEVILLWIKQMFFALAVDGLGTFIYMTIEIIKGMRYFMLLLLMLFVSFSTSFMVLFRGPGLEAHYADLAPDAPPNTPLNAPPGASPLPSSPPPDSGSSAGDGASLLFGHYQDLSSAFLSAFLTMFGNGTEDPRNGLDTDWPQISTILLCIYQFILIVILLNMLITLMAEVYSKVVQKEKHVFLQGRAELIIEVETTMNSDADRSMVTPPYLHLLRPVSKASRAEQSKLEQSNVESGNGNSDKDNGDNEGQAGAGPGGGGGNGGAGGHDSGSLGLQRSISRRDDGFGNQTMRRKTMMRGMSYMGEEPIAMPVGGAGIDGDMVLREMLTMKRMMEGLMKQVRILEANQQHLMAMSKSALMPIEGSLRPSMAGFSNDGTGGQMPTIAGLSVRSTHAQFQQDRLSNGSLPAVPTDQCAATSRRGSTLGLRMTLPVISESGKLRAESAELPEDGSEAGALQQSLNQSLKSAMKHHSKGDVADAWGPDTHVRQDKTVSHITFTDGISSEQGEPPGEGEVDLPNLLPPPAHPPLQPDASKSSPESSSSTTRVPPPRAMSLQSVKSVGTLHDAPPANGLP